MLHALMEINSVANKSLQIVYCAWIAFELVFVYFFLVETKNRTLEETSVYVFTNLPLRENT